MSVQKNNFISFENLDDSKFKELEIQNGKYKQFRLQIYNNNRPFIVFETGLIFQKLEPPKNEDKGIWCIKHNYTTEERRFEFNAMGKIFNRGKFILHAFENFNMGDKSKNIEFIDGDEKNYNLKNLRLTDKITINPRLEKFKEYFSKLCKMYKYSKHW